MKDIEALPVTDVAVLDADGPPPAVVTEAHTAAP
jgi:hypothetical protein